MKSSAISAIAFVVTMLSVTPALAITLTNQNKNEQTFTVDQGETQADQKVAAGASATVECTSGCEVRVRGSGYGRSAKTGDMLVIDDQGLIRFADEDMVTGSVNGPANDKTAK